ncbi:hypothetical protein K470DRAFT_261275 [Piedraia hortae CBS 480.64]|uniref:F-box domain-containing protein n=1 Tax=Piedraia hortae CBS 480.64 TaxID=1314780 RepID=A0A6A7C9X8_9PEZI|nr:hypothetical protein K470DRAFT_261275 [Piedraia hortae CBS 480.64]
MWSDLATDFLWRSVEPGVFETIDESRKERYLRKVRELRLTATQSWRTMVRSNQVQVSSLPQLSSIVIHIVILRPYVPEGVDESLTNWIPGNIKHLTIRGGTWDWPRLALTLDRLNVIESLDLREAGYTVSVVEKLLSKLASRPGFKHLMVHDGMHSAMIDRCIEGQWPRALIGQEIPQDTVPIPIHPKIKPDYAVLDVSVTRLQSMVFDMRSLSSLQELKIGFRWPRMRGICKIQRDDILIFKTLTNLRTLELSLPDSWLCPTAYLFKDKDLGELVSAMSSLEHFRIDFYSQFTAMALVMLGRSCPRLVSCLFSSNVFDLEPLGYETEPIFPNLKFLCLGSVMLGQMRQDDKIAAYIKGLIIRQHAPNMEVFHANDANVAHIISEMRRNRKRQRKQQILHRCRVAGKKLWRCLPICVRGTPPFH